MGDVHDMCSNAHRFNLNRSCRPETLAEAGVYASATNVARLPKWFGMGIGHAAVNGLGGWNSCILRTWPFVISGRGVLKRAEEP